MSRNPLLSFQFFTILVFASFQRYLGCPTMQKNAHPTKFATGAGVKRWVVTIILPIVERADHFLRGDR